MTHVSLVCGATLPDGTSGWLLMIQHTNNETNGVGTEVVRYFTPEANWNCLGENVMERLRLFDDRWVSCDGWLESITVKPV